MSYLLALPIRHKIFYFILGLIIFPLLFACTRRPKQKQYIIGFSQCVETNLWRKTMLQEMKRELSFHPDISFIYKQADGNSQKQVKQVQQLLAQKIDLLIISPQEAETLSPIVEETYKKGIPVIVLDRKVTTPLYSAFVGGDNYEIGKMAGQYVINLLNGKGKIIEVAGFFKATPAVGRHNGFLDALKNYPSMHVVHQVNTDPRNPDTQINLSKIADQYPDVDLIFAHNDIMAQYTYNAYKSKGYARMPFIIGVDGLPGKEAGMQMVIDKKLTATMLYPTGGEEAIQTALKILYKEEFKKENYLETTVIDASNVRVMHRQAAKVVNQQHDIERQDLMLREQRSMYNTQRTFLYILVFALVLLLTLGVISFYSLRENRKINKQLHAQNLEISEQKQKIEEMSKKAQAANEAKVNFFTNISHEFRTPLTLILAPLEELLANTRNKGALQGLGLIQKNVFRLLRLVNQLMDFRKIEVEKMKVRATENEIISFVSEIVNTYKSIAQKRNIDLRLITNERQLNVWFDANMIDKVIFNLLSNAFKFTGDNGYIYVYVNKSEDSHEVQIKVEDNGVGMTRDAQEHAFEVFYQGEFENYKGSGLGLALSKELIQLHKGSISVHSEKWKKTIFEVSLPLGNSHLSKEEMNISVSTPTPIYEHEKIFTSECEKEQAEKKEPEHACSEKEYTILIVEDNKDLRQLLASKLSTQYNILEEENGQTALQQAFDQLPDLIICDVVIPGKDGMTLTSILKKDVRTGHIPIVMLTAKTAIVQQIEGMRNMADAYITKPFNIQFLEENIKSLLSNRNRLKEHFTGSLSSQLKQQTISKLDRKFINDFTALVESNLSNEHFNVEEICKSMGISRVQLYKKMKTLINMNVNEYILNTRLQKAKYLLQHEEHSIGEIAYQVGFSSPTYFTAVFKSKFGVTPKVFKTM